MSNKNIIRVSAVSMNLTPRDWDGNLEKINNGIKKASKMGASLIVTPELSITGYGNEDMFFMSDMEENSLNSLSKIEIPENTCVVVGIPLCVGNRLYNGSAFLTSKNDMVSVEGIYLKQNLAKNGVHYEPRWFNAWNKEEVSEIEILNQKVPVGDITFSLNGIVIGHEICEDAWVASRPGVELFAKGVDIIINPSASHFATGKYKIREQLIIEGSRAFGAAYIYTNINGCESGRAIFDGGNMIANGGKVIARGRRLFFDDIDVTVADIDLWENKIVHQNSSQNLKLHNYNHISINLKFDENSNINLSNEEKENWEMSKNIELEETVKAVALGMFDWLKKTKTNGYMLSLSGGADSALCAVEVSIMVENIFQDFNVKKFKDLPVWIQESNKELKDKKFESKEELKISLMNNLLWCVYQGTENSSNTTLNAAKNLSDSIGSKFGNWNIDSEVTSYTQKVEAFIERQLSWEKDDITLQNIQARVRVPGLWMLANVSNKLLMTTSNMSESAVGYQTMDGDSAGCLAPIIGIRKSNILKILKWLYEEGIELKEGNKKYKGLNDVVNQKPTAELRPVEQNDEEDLMPFYILDFIISETIILRRGPVDLFYSMKNKINGYTEKELVGFITRYFELFSRNQWKRDRSAPGFHIEQDSLDPKTYARFPILNSGMKKELNKLKEMI